MCIVQAGNVTGETVRIVDAGNAADTNGLGQVDADFRIGRFEVTNAEYVAFLNAVAVNDPNGLYDTLMTSSDRGGIVRAGTPGNYFYTLKADFANKPVGGTDWRDAARFCNWLHNGQPIGPQSGATTEDGAYDISLPLDQIARKTGAKWFLPTHDEWYKAAYYDPFNSAADARGTPDYWRYPTQSDTQPAQATADANGNVVNPGANIANHTKGADWNGENGNVTTVGGCIAISAWGVLDLGGNMNEHTETLGLPIPPSPPEHPAPRPTRILRGGDFSNTGLLMASPDWLASDLNMVAAGMNIGFRVARPHAMVADINEDGGVNVFDLLMLLDSWGACDSPCPPLCESDLTDASDGNPDCTVDVFDLLLLLSNWS